ncbi:putative disease resistance RPP13-like protein 1 [Cornus florida]|uniref:putative disease resistance RPP13-like protein 1 n=1 Tax=Cornus florida TaxID=4283 RepID=UPI0028963D5C|nr:putative disease resistance RPP13-like protein 1 [Cornus florida]XP_059652594.1 putative disease resistance RPP13-like protein 1 [Cornus florida]XP_059652595.1 putative disease resistance RPP13-like protein 1 [Cornus florida]XP_059652596.1 putative disease resistance RPP13-like protein 1 [Cornus florida]XP_059652598.1 putative disease resistance RPP13-like protein 1 [Cornus florida]
MAEALVGGAFLSASLQVLFDRLASREFISFFSKQRLDDGLIEKLRRTLLVLQAVLDDAEDKQITNKHVKDWLDELQHVVYQAEDLLEEIATKALRNKLEADRDQSQAQVSTPQVGISRFFGPIKQSLLRITHPVSTSPYLSDEEIESKLKGVIIKLEWFVQQKNSLNLRENVGRKQWQRQETTSLVYEYEVYGRNTDKEKIMKLLFSDNATANQIHVIPIVGMGGMGKTTLAQLIYNDAEVNEKFQMKAWVCVSDAFDSYMITKKIFDDVTTSNNTINNLDQLQIKLKESLARKKFLIVLDDVWNHNYNDWDCLKRPFSAGAHESRIIVTTRIDEVASAMGTFPSYHLKQLSFEDCWSLFAKHAFRNRDHIANSDLETIGKQIVEKCKGLPLAVKSLGGLLRSKLDIEDWKNILKSEIWDLESDISPALRLSYLYLPSHLKRCFACCSKFPKDYKFEKEKLVRLWIAEDLVQQPKNNKLVENEGNFYFRELLSRSFFQRLSHDNDFEFLMHDLIHDLAQHISGDFCFRLEYDKPLDHISEKVRHFSYIQCRYDAFEKFKVVKEVKCLRTFISFPVRGCFFCLGNKVLHDMLPSLRCLRVLSLSRYWISKLPESIENLILLRYLDLSMTKIRQLPDSITTLFNLQTLDLSYCEDLIELPVNIGKLINLRYLGVSGTALTEMPIQMSRLKNLQHLTYFVVGKNSGSRINGLKELYHLRGKLLISGLQNVTSGLDASEANLKGKEDLEGLELEWGGDTNDSQKERDVLDKLEPHAGVKDLRIIKYGGTRFPDWLERSYSLHKMVSLKLVRCAYCSSLPSIGQLHSLKYLRIEGMKAITKVGREFYGDSFSIKPFQSLETLSFKEMPEWEKWHALGVEEFPCLSELSFVDCPKLTGELPNHFPCLRKLEISGCQRLLSSQVGQLLQHLPSLQELTASKLSDLTELPTELQDLCSLQKLEISWMPKLKQLPSELCRLINLESLVMNHCPRLKSFSDMGLPPLLKTLKIKECDALHSLPLPQGSYFSSLQVSLPIGGLPATLKTLDVLNCRSLLKFPLSKGMEHNYHSSIEVLRFSGCDLLKSLSLGFFPKLNSLEILGCKNFEMLSIPNNKELQNLVKLKVEDCPKIVSFPHGDGGFPASNLTTFSIGSCNNLKSLPQRMHTLLPSLQELTIWSCPEVDSFPDGGLPSNLRQLAIFNCEKLMKGRMGWGLQTLPSLGVFFISGKPEEQGEEEELESFPEEWLFPTTLTSLDISFLRNLKSLNHKGLQHLTSLTSLSILYCPKLQSLPEEGLPNSLSFLNISECPLLKTSCQWEKGEDWLKISRIPHISLNREEHIINLE